MLEQFQLTLAVPEAERLKEWASLRKSNDNCHLCTKLPRETTRRKHWRLGLCQAVSAVVCGSMSNHRHSNRTCIFRR